MTTKTKWILAVAALVVAFLLGRSWLAQHDARLQADDVIKRSQTDIQGLQQQQAVVSKAAAQKVSALQKTAKTIDTAPKAIELIPSVSTVDLQSEALPEMPAKVAVDAVSLYQQLNQDRQDSTNLEACSKELELQKGITDQKDVQIQALKQKPSFWHRVGKAAKVTACAAGGAAAGGYLKGAEGAAIGGAAAAGICQLF